MIKIITIASRGISVSLVGQILIEESVLSWEELELEVVRDARHGHCGSSLEERSGEEMACFEEDLVSLERG